MDIALIGLSLDTLGELLIALSVLFVHVRIAKEHKLDKHIYKEFKKEKYVLILGVMLIIVGYLLQIKVRL